MRALFILAFATGCNIQVPRCEVDVGPTTCNVISTGGTCSVNVSVRSWRSGSAEIFGLECGQSATRCNRTVACDCHRCR